MTEVYTLSSQRERLKRLEPYIGQTPLFRISHVFQKPGVEIYAKLEWHQFAGSVKARAAFQIMKHAVENDELSDGRILLDASSGNTAIAYAAIGAALGVRVKICLPENASSARKQLLEAYGAEIHFTSPFGTTDEAQEEAKRIYRENPELYYYADQYNNPNNWGAHYTHTAEEIFEQTKGRITHFVCGVGTSGTFVGTSRKLRELNKDITLVSLQPEAALHGLEGWKHMKTARVPGIYDPSIAHQTLTVESQEALDLIRLTALKEGLLLSPSSAANLAGAIALAKHVEEGVIVTVFPDMGERYSEVLKELYKGNRNG